MIITLNTPKQITITPAVKAVKKTLTEVELIALQDDFETVKAVINIEGANRVLVLWEGEDYINIGDWTQEQANAKIEELL